MAFAHGKDTKVYVGGYDLTGYVRKQSTEATRETAESTVFGLNSKTYLSGLLDGTMALEGLCDGSTGAIEPVLEAALSTSNTIVSIVPQGNTLGLAMHNIKSEQTKYAIDSSKDDVVSLNADFQSSAGIERTTVHHTKSSESASGQDTAQDGSASSSNGGVGYLHVTNLTGITNLACTIQDSADGSTDWQTILTFAGVTASHDAERVAITGTVRRYTRAKWVFTGSGSSTFIIGFGRK